MEHLVLVVVVDDDELNTQISPRTAHHKTENKITILFIYIGSVSYPVRYEG